MKKVTLSLLLVFLFSCSKKDKTILFETIRELNKIETIEYTSQVTFLPKTDERNNIYRANCFYDFRSKDTLLGAKYHFVSDNKNEQVFDGKKSFNSSIKEERVLYDNKPKKYQVNSSIFGLHSLLEIREVLPLFVKDSTIVIKKIKDTIINDIACHQFNFTIPDRYVSDQKLIHVSDNLKEYVYDYTIAISKKDKFPIFVKTRNSNSDQVISALLSDFRIGATREPSVWNYDRFPDGYLIMNKGEYYKRERIAMENKIGSIAPDFKLPSIHGDTISLPELTNKLTLLEFWFPNCGGCVEAIPHINEMQKEYGEQGLTIYGIEFTTTNNERLKEYIKKENIKIPNLYLGKQTAALYDVYAAPTFVLLNSKKEILYIHLGLDKDELITEIEKHLKA